MEFGVFDHLDRTGQKLPDFYEDRLKIAEAYDRAGFYAYHLAEHHSTPLGMAPSPNVFLAAVAQRTRRLRFGPLVFVLPLYHPVRLIAEICMLDQMSGGRLELSFGRGASPIEARIFRRRCRGAAGYLCRGLGRDLARADAQGARFPRQVFFLRQRADGARTAAKAAPAAVVRRARARQRRARGEAQPQRRQPRFARRYAAVDRTLSRDVAAAASGRDDAEARASAASSWWRRPMPRRYASPAAPICPGIAASRICRGCAAAPRPIRGRRNGTRWWPSARALPARPKTVTAFLQAQLAETGCNYVVGQFAFGDLTRDECLRSIELFADEVMPALRGEWR